MFFICCGKTVFVYFKIMLFSHFNRQLKRETKCLVQVESIFSGNLLLHHMFRNSGYKFFKLTCSTLQSRSKELFLHIEFFHNLLLIVG